MVKAIANQITKLGIGDLMYDFVTIMRLDCIVWLLIATCYLLLKRSDPGV